MSAITLIKASASGRPSRLSLLPFAMMNIMGSDRHKTCRQPVSSSSTHIVTVKRQLTRSYIVYLFFLHIMLDDVWNEDREKWSGLKKNLMGGARGSRILVTTRSQIVAKISQSIQPYVLKRLDEQQAWSLLKKMAFEEGEEPKEASFVKIGKDILKMCVGEIGRAHV